LPTWGEILKELNETPTPAGTPDWDGVRRKYISDLAKRTGRSTIIYATDFLTGRAPPDQVTINLLDMQAMMEVLKGLPGPNLDLILHTPGGQPEALESLVRYLRTRFDHIRAFVPLAAMSAGTMWALACDEIVMGEHSQLGPIDPQFALAFGEQIRLAPAQAVLDQFELAKTEVRDPANLAAWITVLRSYGPSLLQECKQAQQLSESLVSQWMANYMFKSEADRVTKAAAVARAFADYRTLYSHGRPISRDQASAMAVTAITNLEADNKLQDAVLSVHHATMHTLAGSGAVKIVENNLPRTFALIGGVQVIGEPGKRAPRKSSRTPPKPEGRGTRKRKR
jgi:hypothetical protein